MAEFVYCIVILSIIVAANFVAEQRGSKTARRAIVCATAALPILLGLAITVQIAERDGFVIDGYFYMFWASVAVATLVTTASALLGRSFAQWKRR